MSLYSEYPGICIYANFILIIAINLLLFRIEDRITVDLHLTSTGSIGDLK